MLKELFIKSSCPCYKEFIEKESTKEYFIELDKYLNFEYQNNSVFPIKEKIFRAFSFCCIKDIKVLIIGQDPYHTPGVADGLCFSTSSKITPPSLRNIFKELYNDLKIVRTDTDLTDWANQGIFLINSLLTVKESIPMSHSKIGWEQFISNTLSYISKENQEIIYLSLGNRALEVYKKSGINQNQIIHTSHPSFFSYKKGFEGSKIFSRINQKLIEKYKKPISW